MTGFISFYRAAQLLRWIVFNHPVLDSVAHDCIHSLLVS